MFNTDALLFFFSSVCELHVKTNLRIKYGSSRWSHKAGIKYTKADRMLHLAYKDAEGYRCVHTIDFSGKVMGGLYFARVCNSLNIM